MTYDMKSTVRNQGGAMTGKMEELQQIYENNLPSWKELLNGMCASIGDRLQAEELKFASKVRIKTLESLYAKKQRLADAETGQELQKRARGISPASLPKYQGHADKTVSDDGQGVESENNLEKNLLKALEAHNNEQYLRAIDLYNEVLSIDPPLKVRAIIYNHRGLAFFMLIKERHALTDFEDSVTCDPGYYQALNNRALMLRRMGLTAEAIFNFDKSLAIEEMQADVYFFKAQTHFETKNYQHALQDVETAIRLRPDYQEAKTLLSLIVNREK